MKRALSLLMLLSTLASAADVRVRPENAEIETAVRQALKSLESGDVTFTLVTNAGPRYRIGGAPAFNPDVASRTVTRGGEQVVEFNPAGPMPLVEAVKAELALYLGLSGADNAQAVRARYGGADLNADGKVNLLDFAILTTNYGKSGAGLQGDLNGDGKVDAADVEIFSKFYTLP